MSRAALVMLLLAATASAAPDAPTRPGTYVLRGGTVHVGDGSVLPSADVVLRDGLIASVGSRAAVPEGATVIDCTGKHVAPGFVAADTTIGLVEIGAVRATRDDAEVGDVQPHVAGWSAFNPDSELLGVAMANGVLSAVVAPRGGLVPGRSAVMTLSGWTREDMALKAPAALHVAWPSARIDRAKDAKKPVDEQERERAERLEALDGLLSKARADREDRDAGRSGTDRVEDLRLRSLQPALDGEIPVVVHADSVQQIREALAWSSRHRVRLVLSGARDAWRIAPEIAAAGVPVVIGDVRTMPAHDHDPYDAPFAAPGILRAAGVKIAFTVLDPAHLRNLPDEAAMGIPYGLPAGEALQAITSWPAEIFGVGDRVGRIAPGLLGHVVTWSGPPLEIASRVEHVFVRGEEVPPEDRHSRLWRKYRARPKPAVSAAAGSTR
jgi:imidazolonepropionase-like amidohydrolase